MGCGTSTELDFSTVDTRPQQLRILVNASKGLGEIRRGQDVVIRRGSRIAHWLAPPQCQSFARCTWSFPSEPTYCAAKESKVPECAESRQGVLSALHQCLGAANGPSQSAELHIGSYLGRHGGPTRINLGKAQLPLHERAISLMQGIQLGGVAVVLQPNKSHLALSTLSEHVLALHQPSYNLIFSTSATVFATPRTTAASFLPLRHPTAETGSGAVRYPPCSSAT